MLFLNRELVFGAGIKVFQRDGDLHMHVLTTALAATLPEVPTTPEEAGKEVEGVMLSVATAARLLVFFEAVVAVLVVDLAGFGGGKGIVGFGYCDEFVVGGGIVSR